MDADLRASLASSEDRHWWFEGRRQILSSVLSGLDLPPNPVLLEAGCGSGANLAMLADHGRVMAFEPDASDLERAQDRSIGDVRAGFLPDGIPPEFDGVDVALALDVIEHVDDDAACLEALGRRLRTGGRVLVTVPAHPWMWSRHDDRNDHRRRYTKSGLQSTIREAGLIPERITWFNSRLFPIVAAARTLGRLIGLDAAGTDVPAERINRPLTRVLGGEAAVLNRRDQRMGVSLLAIARLSNDS